jgi:hypothetical protein
MRRVVASILSLILVAGMSAWAAAADSPVKQQPARNSAPTGVGFNVHITGPDSDWDAIKAAGVALIRADFTWSRVERTKGEYDFSTYDTMLDALDKRGIRVDFGLEYRNPLYTNPETTDEGRDAYARWAAASVKHFKGRNVIWELWNEPNVGFWHGNKGEKMNSAEFAAEYVALVKKAVPAMRAADPDCYILGGSVSCLWRDSFQWLDEAFKQGLLRTGISALSVHPYGFPRPETCIDASQPGAVAGQGYGVLREMMARYNAPKDLPVLNSEVGYPTGKKVTLEQQAMLFVRQYMVDQMCDIRMTIWYNWDERDAANHRVRSGGPEPLPVYNACKNMTAEMAGYRFVERLKVGSNVDYVLAFENASKGRKIVAWTVPEKRDESPDKAVAHDVGIPTGSAGGPVAVRDLFGKAVQAKAEAGTVTVNLTGSPQYIDMSGKAGAAK